MDNGVIPNQIQSPSSTLNELNKKTKEFTKPTLNQIDESKQNSNTSFQSNNVVLPSSSEQNSPNSTSSVSIPVNKPAVVPQSVVEAIINQGFPALAKTTKPIPASVFSYRFASPTNNQTPYYISSDIVLSGGIAQQTRRRIVHNEVERRRKDKINGWITKLAEVIPGCSHGKQSKNLVLERAVEYFSEVNNRVTQLDEYQKHNNSLVLDNQALKQRLEDLQKQNSVLQELLQKNNIPIPNTQTCATPTNPQSNPSTANTNEQVQTLSGPSLVPDNTNVTWMAPENIPMTTSSTSIIGATEINQSFSQSVKEVLTSPSLAGSDICSVQQPQTNYSLYTVSSIMNELPQGVVSLVNSNITQETNPVKLAITVDSTAVNNNDIVSASIPIAVKNKSGTKTLGPMCIPEADSLLGSQSHKVQEPLGHETNGVTTMYLAGEGIVSQSRGSSNTQGMTQVVLCQAPKVSKSDSSCSHRPTSIKVCQETLAHVVTHTSSVINLAHQTAPVVSNNSIIIQTQGPILSPGTHIMSTVPSVVCSSLTKHLYSSSLQSINSTNAHQNGILLQPQGVVSLNNYLATIPSVVTTTNNPMNQGVFPMTFGQGAPVASNNVCALASNVLQQGVETLNTNPTPRVNSIPLAPQVLSQTDPKSNQLVTGKLTSGLVTLNVLPKPVGVVTGTPNRILHQQAQNLVTLNVPQTALQVTTCPLSGTKNSCGNSMATPTNSSVNLTPSPRTAFVIVRSTQPQQTLHYTAPSQAVSQINYNLEVENVTTNSATLMSTRAAPSTVVQPAFFQLQTPFPFNTTSPPASAINTTTSVQSIQRGYSSLSKTPSTLASSQPSAKLPKRNGNTKKRQISRSSENSKCKYTKLSKLSQGSVSTLSSSLTNTSTNSYVVRANGNETTEPRNSNAMDICQHEDMLSIQNFSISSLIPSIDSQTPVSGRPNSPRSTRINGELTRTSEASTTQAKTSHSSSNSQRLSHSIDALTRRNNVTVQVQNQNAIQQRQQQRQEQQRQQQQQQQQQRQQQQQQRQQQQQPQQQQKQPQQQQPQSNLLNFSAESLLGSGDDLVSNIQPITCGATNNFNTQNTFTISTFQESASDGSMNQNFSNFSAEALISDSDFIGISNEPQSSRSNFTQEAQSGKQTHSRTQMFSDFSAESLINSSDLNSGLSYAIDNLISRSDNNDNSIAMASVNPNLLHTATSSMLSDNINQSMYSTSIPVTSMLKTSMYPLNTAMPVTPILKNHLTSTVDYQNTTNSSGTDQTSYCTMNLTPFSKYGFSSPQKQQKEIFSYKHNTSTFSYPSSSVTTSPTFLKHSVDSITSSQHNSVSSTTGAFAFNSPLTNTMACPTLNSLYFDQINSQQFPVSSNSYSNNLNRNFQGPTMGSFA